MKIIFMGDSITEGAGLKDKSSRFTDLIANELPVDCVNRGLGGDTTNGMMIRLFPEVFTQSPDAMVFLGGVNDINLTGLYRPTCANIVSVIRIAKDQQVPLFLCLPLPIEPKDMPRRDWDTDRDYERTKYLIGKYAHFLTHFCEGRTEVTLIDTRTPFLDERGNAKRELFVDGIHPNEKGHQLLAQVIGDAIKKTLQP
ncbi:MAG: hypothetical protein IKM26_00585 [Clostridia bacterium]|nr:hypothetical protein [Clostridia bacterium]